MGYTIHLQKTATGYRVCLVSDDNGKLVLQGETLKNKSDAQDVIDGICGQWNSASVMHGVRLGKALKADHKFVKNAGPKPKKSGIVTLGGKYTYKVPSATVAKKLAKKSPPHIKAWLGAPKKKAPKKR